MPSEAEICNLSLMMLGAATIVSPDDESDRAMLCSMFYPQVRDEVLRAHPWNCARVRRTLAALSEPPVYKYTYKFPLPTDPYCLKVLDVNDNPDIEWKIEGRDLVTNESTVNILYTGRVDVGTFDALLVSAIARRLAAQLAYPITSKGTLFEAMWRAYELVLAEARTVDSQEGSASSFWSDDLIRVR